MVKRAKLLNQNDIKIAELLSDCLFHDGISIGKNLNITRAAVWKVIKKFTQYSIPLISVKGKGYRFESPVILLSTAKIKSQLRHHLDKIDVFEKTESTNDDLKKVINQNKKVRVCIAETQIKGKGRLNRSWFSPFGKNIYLSMLYPFEKDISELSGLSLVVGLAICRAIEESINTSVGALCAVPEKFMMKWPNDVYFGHSKLAGTLIETQSEANGFCNAVIGIGINVNMTDALKKDIDKPWTSLLKITHQYQDRNILCALLIDNLIDYLERFSSNGLLSFLAEWEKRDCLFKKNITIVSGAKKQKGICSGINNQGHLLLKTRSSKVQAFSSGDTTLAK